jgi:hypothetical protein
MQVRSAAGAARYHGRFAPFRWPNGLGLSLAGLRRGEDSLLSSAKLDARLSCGIHHGDASFGNRNVNLSAGLMIDAEDRPQVLNFDGPDLDAEKAATVVTDAEPRAPGSQVHGRACGALLGHLKHRGFRCRRDVGSVVEHERRQARRRDRRRCGWCSRQLQRMVRT